MIPSDWTEPESHRWALKERDKRPESLDGQKLWLCTWGTQTALVWARTEEWAEARVRRRAFDRTLTQAGVMRKPVQVIGDVHVRLATAADLRRWSEARGPKVAGVTPRTGDLLDG